MTKVCAEIGINHDSNFDTLLELTDMAFRCGVDYVKLQTRTPRVSTPKSMWDTPREWFDGTMMTYIEYRERMELSLEQLRVYDEYVRTNYGEHKWATSVWDVPALNMICDYFDLPFIKIPSAMLTNQKLIMWAIERNRPIVLSTGMSTEVEILGALELIPWNYDATILHCTSTYPCDDRECNLLYMKYLQSNPQQYKVGFSNHSSSPYPAIYAALLGASFIESHITLSRTRKGSDHAASLEEAGLRLLVREVRRIPDLMGDGIKRVYDSEMTARNRLRGE